MVQVWLMVHVLTYLLTTNVTIIKDTATIIAVISNAVARKRLNFPRLAFPFISSVFACNNTCIICIKKLSSTIIIWNYWIFGVCLEEYVLYIFIHITVGNKLTAVDAPMAGRVHTSTHGHMKRHKIDSPIEDRHNSSGKPFSICVC